MRVKAIIAYDGSSFKGFQSQKSTTNTITTAIESALSSLQIDSKIVGSGRTDAGVHATAQVIHFDLPYFWRDLAKLKSTLNHKLKHIYIKHITKVDDNFHARFSAKKRVYRYIFKETKPSIFEENYISYYSKFDPTILKKALKIFEGEHNFKYFCKTGSVTHTTNRVIFRTYYKEYKKYHFIYFEANGFLRAQVRTMIEASMQCAKGQLRVDELQNQIDTKHRYTTSLAPPEGLYLSRVIYAV